jgi:hypothetical protein
VGWAPADRHEAGPTLEVKMNRIRPILFGQFGQTTTEYATTLLVVLLVTAALAAFVKTGGLNELFETVVKGLVDKVKG